MTNINYMSKAKVLYERIGLYIDSLETSEAPISQIELEIMLDLARAFYDELKITSLIQQQALLEKQETIFKTAVKEVFVEVQKPVEEIAAIEAVQPEEKTSEIQEKLEQMPESIDKEEEKTFSQMKEEIAVCQEEENQKVENIVVEIIAQAEEKVLPQTEEEIVGPQVEEIQEIESKEISEEEKNIVIETIAQTEEPALENSEQKNEEQKTPSAEKQQPSLFDYLQSNDIGKMVQNVSEKINLAKSEENAPKVVGEKFKQEKPNIFERMSAEGTDLASQFQQKPVKDFRELIGINEKFLFINELFSGDMRAYNDFILALNSCGVRMDAESMLNEQKEKLHWGETTFAYTSLMKIVERKYF